MIRIILALTLPILLAVPGAARAQAGADATATYALYVLGLRMAEGQVHLMYNPSGYRMDVAMRTTGAAAVFVRGQQQSDVEGTWHAAGPLPHVLSSTGTWNGDLHKLVISFESGAPVVTTLIPPDRKQREPIPPDLLRESVDVSSAIAALIRQVSTTGSCERSAHAFDGRRIAEVSAHDAGEETLAPTDRSSFSGPTKRCTFDVRQLSGFERGDDRADAQKTRHATAWLARLTPGGPYLPVRIDMEARLVGEAQLVLANK